MQSILFGIANSVIMMLLAIVATILTVVFTIGGARRPRQQAVAASAGSLVCSSADWLIFWLIAMAVSSD